MTAPVDVWRRSRRPNRLRQNNRRRLHGIGIGEMPDGAAESDAFVAETGAAVTAIAASAMVAFPLADVLPVPGRVDGDADRAAAGRFKRVAAGDADSGHCPRGRSCRCWCCCRPT